MAQVTIREAAEHFGVSPDTIRRRMKRGQLEATKEARAQGFRWVIEIPDEEQDQPQQPRDDAEMAALRAKVEALTAEVESRRDEVSRLYQLLDQQQQLAMAAQRQLTATIEHEEAREQAQQQAQKTPEAPTRPRPRRLSLRERLLGVTYRP